MDGLGKDSGAKGEFDASDVDGALMQRLMDTGIPVFLATGRTLDYVRRLCAAFPVWTCIVAENGAVTYIPSVERTITVDTEHMKQARRIVSGLGLEGAVIGDVIVSVKAKHEKQVREALGGLQGRLNFERNVDEILLLPLKVHKGYGIRNAAQYLHVDMEKMVVCGDSENDVSMFMNPGFKVALANSHPRLKALAHHVAAGKSTAGVRELLDMLVPGKK